jgi:hypothetical protein
MIDIAECLPDSLFIKLKVKQLAIALAAAEIQCF